MQPVRKVACPRCGTGAPFTPENRWRPFCSERCRLIDLGLWASDNYRVPGEALDEDPPDDPTSKPPGS